MPDDSQQHSQYTRADLWEKLKPLAREKRREPMEAEQHLWTRLRNRQLAGVKFRRQHAVGQFIVDFYAAEHALIVEVDGPIHRSSEREDELRQAYLESLGFRLLRFTNEEVLNYPEDVLKKIVETLRG